ncbi:hypothetical protein EPHNCH_1170 [Anaplasma phagocytophilum str. NCH-1]|uniref:Uncharacterized protein n=1 Tax=Anaplasma phagocytophilum str. NCH-1 TaxID=1359161 RepID=A0A0F3N4T5_ANAPH|nr:hypothetical protein EPHNCH_1170 [Anaplasma phagocytophilum str. NCH-1]KJV87321.1 hypothetical protein APHNYW_0861 [Anaplasma phagocytophilum str. ApNYW]
MAWYRATIGSRDVSSKSFIMHKVLQWIFVTDYKKESIFFLHTHSFFDN